MNGSIDKVTPILIRCPCGKVIHKNTLRKDDDSLSLGRDVSSSSVSTLSIRESRTDARYTIIGNGNKCRHCMHAADRYKIQASRVYYDEDAFRPPDEILVDRREGRSQSRDVLTQSRTVRTQESTRSSSTHHFSMNFQHEVATPVVTNTIRGKMFSFSESKASVILQEKETSLQGRIDNNHCIDYSYGGGLPQTSLMDIYQAPSDERDEIDRYQAVENTSADGNPTQQANILRREMIFLDIVNPLELSPSDECNATQRPEPLQGVTAIRSGTEVVSAKELARNPSHSQVVEHDHFLPNKFSCLCIF